MHAGTLIHDLEFFRHSVHSFDRVSASFLEGYEAIAGPLRRPFVTYRPHACLGKAPRAAQELWPDGVARAAYLAGQALQILTGTC